MTDLAWHHLTDDDHADVMRALQHWWGADGGGAERASLLPRLFFQHFAPTSLVVRDGGTLVGFLVGFLSQSRPDEAYIHFVGVHPDRRGLHLGRELYERFFTLVRAQGRTTVRAITSPGNSGSQAFHARLGFAVSAPVADYDGPGLDRVCFVLSLDDRAAGEADSG